MFGDEIKKYQAEVWWFHSMELYPLWMLSCSDHPAKI